MKINKWSKIEDQELEKISAKMDALDEFSNILVRVILKILGTNETELEAFFI